MVYVCVEDRPNSAKSFGLPKAALLDETERRRFLPKLSSKHKQAG